MENRSRRATGLGESNNEQGHGAIQSRASATRPRTLPEDKNVNALGELERQRRLLLDQQDTQTLLVEASPSVDEDFGSDARAQGRATARRE